jgi:hypothetical protein
MPKYLGEEILNIEETEYKDYTKNDWILLFLEKYGLVEGTWSKNWLMDTIAQLANDTKIIIKLAKWDDGQEEYRFELDNPSNKYIKWLELFNEEDEDYGIFNGWKELNN